MPDLVILDRDYKQMLPIVDVYSSLQWIRRYYEAGEFEVHAPVKFYDLFSSGGYVYRNDARETGVIEDFGYSLNENGQETAYAKGRFLNVLLDDHVIERTKSISGNVETIMRSLVNEYAIAQGDRREAKLTLGAVTGVGLNINTQVTGDSLMSYFDTLSLEQEISYLLRFDLLQDKIFFEVWQGLDRTDGQNINNHAIFTTDLENISTATYSKNIRDYKNVAYVAGSDEAVNRIVEVVNLMKSGERRREVYFDARDLQPKDDSGNAISEAAYRALLRQRGLEKLKEKQVQESIESTINQFGNLEYKKDFDLGDLCVVRLNRIGIETNQRIVEIREVYENNGLLIEVVFGTEKMTLRKFIDRRIKNG